MIVKTAIAILAAGLFAGTAAAAEPSDGLVTLKSKHPFGETLSRLEQHLKENGQTIFARFDHIANAESVVLTMRPTTVIVFGNPKGGTPMMQQVQALAIDLPMKFLVAEEADGGVTVSYNDPLWLGKRHHLPASLDGTVKAIAEFVGNQAKFATE